MKLMLILSTMLCSLNTFATPNLIPVPAQAIYYAAQTIIAQTGVIYSVSGQIECVEIAREFPPYGVDSSFCEISILGHKARLLDHAKLMQALKKIKPATGPYYRLTAHFDVLAMEALFNIPKLSASIYFINSKK
jgi:hypothetical protein